LRHDVVAFACAHRFRGCSAIERRRDVDSSLRCALCRSRVYLSVFYVHRWRSACSNTDASDSKRVQVLQVQEVSATNESSVKKSKTAATLAKKKVAQRRTTRQTKAAANEGANTPLQSAMAVVVPATPAQNDTLALSAEQTGTLAVGDRAVALASSPGEDNNVGLSLANYVGTREDPSSAIAVGNPPRAISDTEQTPGTQMAGQKVPSSKNSPLSQALATLSGAMLAAAFGWHLVNSSRRHISLGVGT
jgi:hypothetical protein